MHYSKIKASELYTNADLVLLSAEVVVVGGGVVVVVVVNYCGELG
jgi:hypothetical protein